VTKYFSQTIQRCKRSRRL